MRFKIEFKGFSFYAGANRFQMVDGYNSNLPDGSHFLMWDFDDVELATVEGELKKVQQAFNLPTIYIMSSGKPNCWHANCFKATPWEVVRAIIGLTPSVDKKYLSIGILRGFFTLRYSPVGKREIEIAGILESRVPEDVNPLNLTSFSTYPKKVR